MGELKKVYEAYIEIKSNQYKESDEIFSDFYTHDDFFDDLFIDPEFKKVIEYRERTDYWDKRIGNREYKYLRITNGYGNLTRPYRLYRYTGATRVMKDNQQCYAIDINPALIVESRDRVIEKSRE